MKVKVYNKTGKETGELDLNEAIFGVKIKPEVVHQVFISQMNNQREPWADTKNRGEVSGGGKKPWAQKGTGRARHGSIRSPIWRGGGVTFGPLSIRNYKEKINKKTRRLAVKMCLSDKIINNLLVVLEDFDFSEPKTKVFQNVLKQLPIKGKHFLILTVGKDENLLRMTGNIQAVQTKRAEDISVMDLVNNGAVIITKEGVKKIEEVLN